MHIYASCQPKFTSKAEIFSTKKSRPNGRSENQNSHPNLKYRVFNILGRRNREPCMYFTIFFYLTEAFSV